MEQWDKRNKKIEEYEDILSAGFKAYLFTPYFKSKDEETEKSTAHDEDDTDERNTVTYFRWQRQENPDRRGSMHILASLY